MEDYEKLQELLRKADDYTAVQLEVWNVPIGDPMRAKLYFAVFNTRLAALIEADPPKNTPNPTASYRLTERPTPTPDHEILASLIKYIDNQADNYLRVASNPNINPDLKSNVLALHRKLHEVLDVIIKLGYVPHVSITEDKNDISSNT